MLTCRGRPGTYGTLPYTDLMATPVRSRRIEIRVTEDEHAAEDIAARTLGVSLSEFYRQAARERGWCGRTNPS